MDLPRFEYDDIPDKPPEYLSPFYFFSKDTILHSQPMDMEPQPHAEMCQFIEDAVGDCRFRGDSQTLAMLGVPRNTFKTSVTTESLPLYVLDKNPNARILITSYRHDVAKKRNYAVKWHIENNEVFRSACGDDWKPEFRDDIWNDDSIVITRRSTAFREPSVSCAGVDRSMTGSHFDLIIADDLVTDTNVRTPEGRQKVYDYIQDLLPILEPGGTLILVFTRWHPDDAYGRLIAIDEELVRRGEKPEWRKLIRSAYLPNGDLYFPTRLTHDFLAGQRRRLGSRKFAAQYLNQPISEEDKTFNMEIEQIKDFTFFTDSTLPCSGLVRTKDGGQYPINNNLLWDPAGRKSNRNSDSHGLVVAGCDPRNRWWLCEAEGFKGTPTAVINRVCSLILHYRPRKVSCEDVAAQGLWLDLLRQELIKRDIPVPAFVEYSTGGVPKGARIELLQPKWEAGDIIMRPGQFELRRQFDQFTPGSVMDHEDVIDALAQNLKIAVPGPEISLTKGSSNPKDEEWVKRQKRVRVRPEWTAGALGSRWGI